MLTVKLRALGGSTVIAIPPAMLSQLGLAASSEVSIAVDGGRLIIEAKQRPKYTLAELLAQCDFSIPPSEEETEWLNAPPVGREEI